MNAIAQAILKVVTESVPYLEIALAMGKDVAPFVLALSNSLTEIGGPGIVDTDEYKAAQAAIKPYEDHIQAAAAAARLEQS